MCSQEWADTNLSNRIEEPTLDSTSRMEKYHFLALCFLLYTLDITLPTQAYLLSNICENNQNADTLIHGDSQNAVNNFAHVISEKRKFDLYGDNETYIGGCRRPALENRHRKGWEYDNVIWVLDCWDPVECLMIETEEYQRDALKLLPFSSSPSGHVNVKTVMLPIDLLTTTSYTFLPDATQKSIFFVTSLLTGCSVFVAKPENSNCNIIVMHSNFLCSSSRRTDYNHKQAMVALESIRKTNKYCTYTVQSIRRWAADINRDIIVEAHYPYANNIFFYSMSYVNFLYGYKVGGVSARWRFCIKGLHNGEPAEHCIDI
ncbi:uncharacterized protein LOC123557725 [Mercenaria mercenaria]|uniref:uncharacterized protein LOC123557725 n=1 Tax=Mercenaria mercenaria TaxID=6596 RepID=UPI00234F4E46|nr:uncharacterized protein LOC123557725 [Mercenaria mercenaria]